MNIYHVWCSLKTNYGVAAMHLHSIGIYNWTAERIENITNLEESE